ALTFQNHTDCPLTDFGGKTSIFSHPVYLFLRKFSLQDSRGGSVHTDDTPVKVLAPGRKKAKTGYIWTYVRDDRNAGSPEPPAVW
ncbi:transposase, partial [Escherichia coli]